MQPVVVAGQSEHGGVVAEIAHHPDGLAERQSSHDACRKPNGAQSKGPGHGHDSGHAPQGVDGVLLQRKTNCDQSVVGEDRQGIRLQGGKGVVDKHLQHAHAKRDKVVLEEERAQHAGNGARVQDDVNHCQVDDGDKLWGVQAGSDGDDVDHQGVKQQCDRIDESEEDEVNGDEWERLKANDVEAWRVNDKRVVGRGPEMRHRWKPQSDRVGSACLEENVQ